ncbi:Hypothetical protein R9X50_00744000 [Acrodontium crateriforme]|uniref:Uncharacterized protein n=1 Tax=Acrodontium crateriforme TaxID=150365 RepID=A0AAQ3MBU9_9PEZI|nr:Hypothetical protein R9X50_00744000 [Acrodontium crateriforme]
MGKMFRNIFCFCDRRDGRDGRRTPLKISAPTDFRRGDITIPGLDPEQQRFIREKAISDAERMWEHLQPLKSSPSTEFAIRPAAHPSFQAFTRPRGAPGNGAHRRSISAQVPAAMNRIRDHSRKFSNTLIKPLGYHVVEAHSERDLSRPKTSGAESFSLGSKTDSDKDSVTDIFTGNF